MGDAGAFDLDPDLLREFLAESLETLTGLDALFVQLERHPEDQATIDAIFRPIHSIKGNSSFFGLTNVKNFSHAMENLLQEIRGRKRQASRSVTDKLLAGVDRLREMLERIAGGDLSTDLRPGEEALLGEFQKLLESEEAGLADLLGRLREEIESTRAAVPGAAESLQAAQATLGELRRLLLPAESRDTGGDELIYRIGATYCTESVRTAVDFVRNVGEASGDETRVEAFLAALGELGAAAADDPALTERLGQLHTDFSAIHESGIGFDDLLASLLKERLDAVLSAVETCDAAAGVCTLNGEKTADFTVADAAAATADADPDEAEAGEVAPEPEASAAREEEPRKAQDAPAQQGKTLRVAEEKVDAFMGFVGELIIANEVFNYIQKRLERQPGVREIAQEFKNANLTFSELSNNLQKSLMAVRRVPLKTTVQKLPRIVRDIATSQGKRVDFVIEGDDLQIDKSLLEGLEDPLVHMVRNSVDHGIEDPEARAAAGKPPEGRVTLRAEADEETFRLVLRDDGRGIDVQAIKAKAVANGLLAQEAADAMPDREAFGLIFGAGVSTARTVTDVSGRGVGMDVVRSNIERLNGQIEIDSAVGEGTTVTIQLPMTVTLMVVDGLVARVGQEHYILPMAEVRESFRPEPGSVSTVAGRGELVKVRGDLYRLIRLHELLGIRPESEDPEAATVVLLEARGESCGLLVDELVSQQSVVLKDLGRSFAHLSTVKGGAILGDGRVGLVLDIEGLIAYSKNGRHRPAREPAAATA
jgi:two-component system chemotaxis sensor kinase CheA